MPALRRVRAFVGYACAGAFVLLAAAGVTVGVLTHEPGPADPPRDGVPPAVQFGDDRRPAYEPEMGK